MTQSVVKDLIVLVADKNMEFAVKGILGRPQALHIRPVHADIRVHLERDPGVLKSSHDFLRPFTRQFAHALVMLDREGCGKNASRVDLEREIEERLASSGWAERSAAVVIDPELDVWIWSTSPHVDAALGWSTRSPELRTWLCDQGWLKPDQPKPPRPKEAAEAALREVLKPRSSAIYRELAEKVSLERCMDSSFDKLKQSLQRWFSSSL